MKAFSGKMKSMTLDDIFGEKLPRCPNCLQDKRFVVKLENGRYGKVWNSPFIEDPDTALYLGDEYDELADKRVTYVKCLECGWTGKPQSIYRVVEFTRRKMLIQLLKNVIDYVTEIKRIAEEYKYIPEIHDKLEPLCTKIVEEFTKLRKKIFPHVGKSVRRKKC